jgi:hypothetical protein
LSWSRCLSVLVLPLSLLQDRLPYEGSLNTASLTAQLDPVCLLRTWIIKGALACPYECVWVENAYPCGVLEVVRQSGRSHLAEFPRLDLKTTSGHNEQRLQFADTRVFTFVPRLTQNLEIPIAAPDGATHSLNYVSEFDAPGWRAGLLELFRPPLRECAGNWGCYAPRTGFLTHQSEPIAAHVQALRAGRVAAQPMGRIVISAYDYEPRTGHYLQMVSPVRRSCVSIGHPDLKALESGGLSPYGAYLFVQWGLFEECERCLPPRLLPPRAPGP